MVFPTLFPQRWHVDASKFNTFFFSQKKVLKFNFYCYMWIPHEKYIQLKGRTMIFAGQENPFIIFKSKDIYIYFKTNNKISINLLK